jgi:hypothetical protein
MPPSRHLLPLVPDASGRAAGRLTVSPATLLASLALLAVAAPGAGAQRSAVAGTPLHVPVSRFEFVASSDTQPAAKPVAVHNGGTTPLTGVRVTQLSYAGSPRGAAWLIARPAQTAVAPNELATVGMLCVNASGLPAGTYRATAAVAAREVPNPVPVTITLTVTSAARTRDVPARCGTSATK